MPERDFNLETLERESHENPYVSKFEEFFGSVYKKHVELLVGQYPQKHSLMVDFKQLERFDIELADALLDEPDILLEAASMAVEKIDVPALEITEFKPHVRFFNLPADREPLIMNIGAEHLGKLIAVEGIIAQITDVLPKLKIAVWQCRRCANTYKILQEKPELKMPDFCECRHRDFVLVPEKSHFIDFQKIKIQESLEKLKGNEQAAYVDIYVSEDLVNRVNVGAKIKFCGILRLMQVKDGKTVYGRFLEAHHIEETEKEFSEVEITPEEEKEIKKFAADPLIYEKLVRSIAPAIYGHEVVKEAIALQLFGGVKKTLPGDAYVRGNIHVLLVGDPGMAKSQLLMAAHNIAPKSIYVAGKTTSGVGLCVAPETLILNDNGFKDIKSFVEEKFNTENAKEEIPMAFSNEFEGKCFSVNENLKIGDSKIYKIWKIKAPEKMVKIKTRLGKEIIITPQTPLLCNKNENAEWAKAKDLKLGNFVACARKLPEGKIEKIPTIAFLEQNKNIKIKNNIAPILREITNKLVGQYGSLQNIAKKIGKSRDTIYAIRNEKFYHGISLKNFLQLGKEADYSVDKLSAFVEEIFISHGKNMKIPRYIDSKELAYLAGLALGDGNVYLRKNENSASVRIFSASPELLEKVDEIVEQQFGILPEKFDDGKRVPGRRIKFTAFFEILKAFGLSEKKQHISVSHLATEMKNEILASLLKGLFDTDGYVSVPTKHRGSPHVGIGTISKELAQKIQLSLLKFGIASKLRLRKKAGKIAIGKKITVTSRFDQYYIEIRGKSNLEKFNKEIGFGLQRKKEKLSNVLEKISKEGHSNIEKIKGNEDIVWEEIVEIEEKKPDYDFVYDFSVEKSHNFVGNGFIVHNTATAVKDDFGEGGWTLKAGALVLSSGGMCMTDELDKMEAEERSALHEAMEQGMISVAKAGIVTRFKADTSILAAANPKFARFDQYQPFIQQVDLPPTLISRFDLFFMIKDVLDRTKDEKIAEHILKTHRVGEMISQQKRKGTTTKKKEIEELKKAVTPEIMPELLKKYISYTRQNIFPILTSESIKLISDFYVELRDMGRKEGSYSATHRQLEGLVRLSEASARIRLSDVVEVEDAQRAIRLVKNSLEDVVTDPETGKIDYDIIVSGQTHTKLNNMKKILNIIKSKAQEMEMVPVDEVILEAAKEKIDEEKVKDILAELEKKGEIYKPRYHFVKPSQKSG